MRSSRNRVVFAGSSLAVLGVALAAAPVSAQDTTIATSVTTGASWNGDTAPNSNFTITSTGTINTADPSAITVTSAAGATLGTLLNEGVVNDTFGTGNAIGLGTISVGALTNAATGLISAAKTGVFIGTAGTIGALSNSGTISGFFGITQAGSIGSIGNTGTITGSARGIFTTVTSRIGTIDNAGLISAGVMGANAAGGVANGGVIATLINTGTIISSHSSGIGNNQNGASIGQITNSGLISGVTGGIWNQGTMSQITNTGRIIGTQAGVFHAGGTIGTINNSGTISGSSYGISIGAGTFNSLINSGTVRGAIALYLGSGVPALNVANSGVIAGNITNTSANALTITGGTGSTFGTLTGSTLTNQGSIISTLSNLVFASGNLLLNDNINATGRTVSNTGATLALNSIVNIAGAYTQTAGTLDLSPTAGGLVASGAAIVSGGTISANFASTGNYLAGTYTLLGGSSINLTGATVTIGQLTGLNRSDTTTGTALQLLIKNDYVGGTLASVTNAAGLSGSNTGLYVATTGSIGTVSNTGVLSGWSFGVNNLGTIDLLDNSGRITSGSSTGMRNQGSIGRLVNTGTINSNSWAILNDGTLGTLINSGTIAGQDNAIQNNGLITLIDNSGTMLGGSNAIAGTFGTLVNSGVIQGNINGDGGRLDTIIGGSNGTVGMLTGFDFVSQGTIGVSANLTFASGALLLNDAISAKNVAASGVTVSNTGANITLSTIVNVDANFHQSAGSLNLGNAGKLVVTQAASITGGTITTGANGLSAAATYLKGATGGTLVSGGIGSTYTGVSIAMNGGFTGLAVADTVSGNDLMLAVNNDYIGDTQISIGNTGTISGVTYPVYVANTGSIGTFTNSGALMGLADGFNNNGSIGSLSNSGLISGAQKGLGNQSTITNLVNTSTGTILGGTAAGLQNDTSMGTVTNAGLISSGSAGFANYGTLGLLSNSGSINGGPQGIYLDGNSGTGTIDNSGTITSGQSAIQVSGTLSALTNSGFIGNATNGVNVAGTLTTLVNQAGGTISGNNVVYISGSLGGLSNSGVIKGRIDNQTANALTITGGAAGTIGTLTGTAGIGTINNTLSNLVFASGNLLLNDRIIATGRTVSNTGASLWLDSIINITGAYSQTAGTLNLTPGTSRLIVSGAANLSGGTVAASLSSTANYLAGSSTLVGGGAGSSFAGATISLTSITGLSRTTSISGNDLLLTVNNDCVGGTLATLTNADSLTGASTGLYVATTGSIGTMSNTGTIGGAQFGVNNRGTIGRLVNSGRITNNNFTALWNQGSIGELANTGTITNSSWAILNSGTIGTVTNSGVIAGAGTAIQNNGVIGLVNNSGTMTGQSALSGTFGTIINSGVIRGNINRSGGLIGTIIGGTGGAVGTFTGLSIGSQGTIGASGNLTFASGALLLDDRITAVGIAASALTISNAGADITLPTIIHIDGNFTQTAGMLNLGSTGGLVVSQAASIIGGTIAVSGLSATGNYLAGTAAGTLVAGGAGSNYAGVSISLSGVTGLAAAAATSGTNLVLGIGNDYVGGTLAAIDNSGMIADVSDAVYIAATGDLGTLGNTGTLSGTNSGVYNLGQIMVLDNSGLITGGNPGIHNAGGITQLMNSGTIRTSDDAVGTGLHNTGSIGTVTNTGLIGNNIGIFNSAGTIALLDNQGMLAGATALLVDGNIGALSNSGTLSGSAAAVSVAASGSIGGIVNSGVIRGSIINASANDLTIAGGNGASIGTLTGMTGQGHIANTASNLVFSGGNLMLNDSIDVTGHSVLNTGAVLTLPGVVSITGDYTQSAGSLAIDPGVGGLAVSGVATLSGGAVVATLSSTGTYRAGMSYTLIQGGTGSSYGGASIVSSGVTGLGVMSSVATIGSATNLLLSVNNDYIGGTQGTLANTGTISTTTAVYVAPGATLGTLSNSGTLSGSANGAVAQGTIGTVSNTGLIQGPNALLAAGGIGMVENSGTMVGNLLNQSATAMTLTGGTSGYGLFTGQGGAQATIVSPGADVLLTSGKILLDDAVDVTGHTLVNGGASVRLDRAVNVTGNYSQTAGTLEVKPGTGMLVVSGAAALSGGTIALTGLSEMGNYLAGDAAGTVVQGGAGSTYTGLHYTHHVTGLELGGTVQGNALVAQFANDYVGGTLAVLTNSRALTAGTAVYVAPTGVLGTLANSNTISGPIAIRNAGSLGTIVNTGVIAGNIENAASADFRIAGGSGTSFGTLTGFAAGNQGTINNLAGNLVLSGNLLLNDVINLGAHRLVADGATLQLNSAVRVNGNYSQTGGMLLVGVTSNAVYGQLQVSGSASLTGATVKLVSLGSGTISAGNAYTVVKAGGALTYSGLTASVTGLDGSFSTATGNGTSDLVLTVATSVPAAQFTQTGASAGGPGVGTGAALDAIIASGSAAATPVITDVLLPLAVLPTGEQQRAVVQLSPTQLTPQMVLVAVSPAVNAIVQHQEVLAANASGREERGMAAGSQGQRGTLWGQVLVNTAKRSVARDASPYAASSFGIVAGVDLIGTTNLVVGGALSWVSSTANGRADLTGSRTRLNAYQATGYFTWQPGDPETSGLAIDGQVSFGYNVYRQQRRIDFLQRTAKSSYDGQQYLGSLRASYTVPVGDSASLTPYAGIREIHLNNDGYAESGAGAADMQVRKVSVDSLNHEIGLQGAAILDGASGRLSPSLKIGWTHNYINGPIPLSSVLGGVTFTSTSARGARDGAMIGAGLSFMQNDRLKISVHYDGELRKAFQSHSGTVKLGISF